MWNIAAQAGTGVAIAGLSATYYALIRKNVEMENRAMDNLVADIPKDEKRNGNEGDVSSRVSEFRLPTTASQNLMRKNFQLMGKESGRISGINVAHSNALLAERNRSESDIDHIVNRTETFTSKSAVALSGARRSKSDFDVFRKVRYPKASRNDSSFHLKKSKSVFDVDTFEFLESSAESLTEEHGIDPCSLPICHCKYSASAEDIRITPSPKQIDIKKCAKDEKIETEAPTVISIATPVCAENSTRKLKQGSLLSDDYIPRLENRDAAVYNLFVPATSSSKRTQDKEAHKSTHVIFPPQKQNISKIPRWLNKGYKQNSTFTGEKVLEKARLENIENVPSFYPYEENNAEFPPAEKLLSLNPQSELEGPLKVSDNIVRYSTSDFKSSKQDPNYPPEYPSSVLLDVPGPKLCSCKVQPQPPVPAKENNLAVVDNSHSPSLLELSTTNSWQMVRDNVKAVLSPLFRLVLFLLQLAVNSRVGYPVLVFFGVMTLAIFYQIVSGIYEEVEPNPADSAFPEQNEL